jgi:acetaldehyde dehydrogenase (acetylating)
MEQDLTAIAEARQAARRARAAWERYRRFDQQTVDRITAAAVEAGHGAAVRLAELAVAETGIGNVAGKTEKNVFCTRHLWQAIGPMRTCGILHEDQELGIWEVADPFGVVAAIIPTTNPTSTALFKALICLKSRNAMVASPHPRARGCIAETVRVLSEAATAAGAPEDLLLCLEHVHLEGTRALMRSPDVDLILATGGLALVREAYSSGKPAFGVGPGNAPAYVDRSADVELAARCIVFSETFDNGTVCASEQAIIADGPVADALTDALVARGAHVCTPDEVRALEAIAIRDGVTNPATVGLAAPSLAGLAGFQVPPGTTLLLAPYDRHQTGPDHPLSLETLCPMLPFYRVSDWEEGCRMCLALLDLGGRGHTLALHARDAQVIRAFAIEKPVNRLLVNSPASQGAVGLTTNLFPSMTLGCGSFGGNITSDNIGPQHLLNIKRVAFVDPAWVSGALREPGPARAGVAGEPVTTPWNRARHDRPAEGAGGDARNPAALRPSGRPGHAGDPRERLPGEHWSQRELEEIVRRGLELRRNGPVG